jgi:hypothetical protein
MDVHVFPKNCNEHSVSDICNANFHFVHFQLKIVRKFNNLNTRSI